MTARTLPTLPTFLAGQKLTAAQLNQVTTYAAFWSSPPSFRMYQTVAQSIGNATFTQITCDTSDYDSDSGRAAGTPWSYTIPAGMSGRWFFGGTVSYTGNATGIRVAALYKNGSQINGANVAVQAGPAGNTTVVEVFATVAVNAGDLISLISYQSSGGALNTQTAASIPSGFEGRLVSLASP